MNLIIACEESQTVCQAFHDYWDAHGIKGNEAYSCDLAPTRGKHQEWHILGDAILATTPLPGFAVLQDGDWCPVNKWTHMIAHPDCRTLTNSGVRWLTNEDGSPNEQRWKEMYQAANFFKKLLYAPIEHIVIENPIMHKYAREAVGVNYGQLIQPYEFGNPNTKATGLWLKNVPALKLDPAKLVPKELRIDTIHKMAPSEHRARDRAVTFPEIAQAFAEQWGELHGKI